MSLREPTMSDLNEKDIDITTVEHAHSLDDAGSVEYKRMTRKVLWKFDCHVLPPLALVRDSGDARTELTSWYTQLWLANFIDRTNVGNARQVYTKSWFLCSLTIS